MPNHEPNTMTDKVQIYLGLGGNIANELGDPTSHILAVRDTLDADERFCDVVLSSLYVSKPFGVTDQPDFVNAVLSAKTSLDAMSLLDFCQDLEQGAGRVRLRRWGERSLDVDILLYGDEVIHNDRLTVPHSGIFERSFVLVPLLELNDKLMINGQAVCDLALAHDMNGLRKLD
ncbi:2-amino-4-hydroxy-6-hydroxymethyldihydropteridine diphosphokinase [Moraxella caprae]|nr:2-amino-4-hydroxy-6-hydroxymethyldihydropteridine diphosphokinase [Moraxella caprae]